MVIMIVIKNHDKSWQQLSTMRYRQAGVRVSGKSASSSETHGCRNHQLLGPHPVCTSQHLVAQVAADAHVQGPAGRVADDAGRLVLQGLGVPGLGD